MWLSLGIVAASTAAVVILLVLNANEIAALIAHIEQRRLPPGMMAALLGAAGGLAKYLERYLEGQAFVILDALAIACISGFCGVIVFDGMIALGLAQDVAKVAGGLSGYYGPRSLDALSQFLAKSAKRKP